MKNKITSKNPAKNKTVRRVMGLIAVIILMSSILAVTIYYQKYQDQITGKVTGLERVSGFATFDVIQIDGKDHVVLGDVLVYLDQIVYDGEGKAYKLERGFLKMIAQPVDNEGKPMGDSFTLYYNYPLFKGFTEKGKSDFFLENPLTPPVPPILAPKEPTPPSTVVPAPTSPDYITLPKSTPFSEIKEGDIIAGSKVNKIEIMGPTEIRITTEDGFIYVAKPDTKIDLSDGGAIFLMESEGETAKNTFGLTVIRPVTTPPAPPPPPPPPPPLPSPAPQPRDSIEAAKAWNADPRNEGYVNTFRTYLIEVEGKTREQANEIIADPKQVMIFQKELAKNDQRVKADGMIGSITAGASATATDNARALKASQEGATVPSQPLPPSEVIKDIDDLQENILYWWNFDKGGWQTGEFKLGEAGTYMQIILQNGVYYGLQYGSGTTYFGSTTDKVEAHYKGIFEWKNRIIKPSEVVQPLARPAAAVVAPPPVTLSDKDVKVVFERDGTTIVQNNKDQKYYYQISRDDKGKTAQYQEMAYDQNKQVFSTKNVQGSSIFLFKNGEVLVATSHQGRIYYNYYVGADKIDVNANIVNNQLEFSAESLESLGRSASISGLDAFKYVTIGQLFFDRLWQATGNRDLKPTKEQEKAIQPTTVQYANWIGDLLKEVQTAIKGYSFFSFLYSEPDPFVDDPNILNLLGGPTGELYGWTSSICVEPATNIHDLGAAFATTLSGAFAHIEGEKATIIDFNASTGQRQPNLFLYKISLKVNPGSESRGCTMKFKVMISGASGRRSLFVDDGDGSDFIFKVEPGGQPVDFSGNNLILAQSKNDFNTVSIIFTELSGLQLPCLDGISEGDELRSTLIDNAPKELNFEDPCSDFHYTFFMPDCWGGAAGGKGESTGVGVGGTTTASQPARRAGAKSGRPAVNI